MGWHGTGYGMAGWAWPMMGLFWLAVIVLIVLAIRWLAPGSEGIGGSTRDRPTSTALGILAERLARGEIDTAEYESRVQALRATR